MAQYESSRDLSQYSPRDLARLRGKKRSGLQILRRACHTRLQLVGQILDSSPLKIAFCQECKELCFANDQRLGDPNMEGITALELFAKELKALCVKYEEMKEDFPDELKRLVMEEKFFLEAEEQLYDLEEERRVVEGEEQLGDLEEEQRVVEGEEQLDDLEEERRIVDGEDQEEK
ncbi:MAG: hypothetical protein Q9165_003025 [Trypethelium subeluteriae]